MRLKIAHTTAYRFDAPIAFGLQELRMTPKSRAGQTVLRWNIAVEGGRKEAQFEDQHNNQVTLISLDENAEAVTIACEGELETTDNAGVVGEHGGFAPLWYFKRSTPLTAPGPQVRKLAKSVGEVDDGGDIGRLHRLMHALADAVAYEPGATHAAVTAEEALAAGAGVCQDHAHAFVAAARALGCPARYVGGYLLMADRIEQDAGHAWAEAYVQGLGWVGFDAANRMSPDARYVRVSTGLDYREAAPVSGLVVGKNAETLSVDIMVEQQ